MQICMRGSVDARVKCFFAKYNILLKVCLALLNYFKVLERLNCLYFFQVMINLNSK